MYLQEPQNLDGLFSSLKKAVKFTAKAPGKIIKGVVGDKKKKEPEPLPVVQEPANIAGVPLDMALGIGGGLAALLILTSKRKGRR